MWDRALALKRNETFEYLFLNHFQSFQTNPRNVLNSFRCKSVENQSEPNSNEQEPSFESESFRPQIHSDYLWLKNSFGFIRIQVLDSREIYWIDFLPICFEQDSKVLRIGSEWFGIGLIRSDWILFGHDLEWLAQLRNTIESDSFNSCETDLGMARISLDWNPIRSYFEFKHVGSSFSFKK